MENKATELVKKWEVKDTPFTIIQDQDNELYFGVIGNYRITELYESKTGLEKELKKVSWNNIMTVVSILLDLNNNKLNIN